MFITDICKCVFQGPQHELVSYSYHAFLCNKIHNFIISMSGQPPLLEDTFNMKGNYFFCIKGVNFDIQKNHYFAVIIRSLIRFNIEVWITAVLKEDTMIKLFLGILFLLECLGVALIYEIRIIRLTRSWPCTTQINSNLFKRGGRTCKHPHFVIFSKGISCYQSIISKTEHRKNTFSKQIVKILFIEFHIYNITCFNLISMLSCAFLH